MLDPTTEGVARTLLLLLIGTSNLSSDDVEAACERMKPPTMPVNTARDRIDAHTLVGRALDFWAGKAMGWDVHRRGDGACMVLTAGGTDEWAFFPHEEAGHAECILHDCMMELKPPAKAGENWEAWFDRKRLTGAAGGPPPVVAAGRDWKEAVARAVVVGRYGDFFDPDNPVDTATAGSTQSVTWGTARAIQTEPGPGGYQQ